MVFFTPHMIPHINSKFMFYKHNNLIGWPIIDFEKIHYTGYVYVSDYEFSFGSVINGVWTDVQDAGVVRFQKEYRNGFLYKVSVKNEPHLGFTLEYDSDNRIVSCTKFNHTVMYTIEYYAHKIIVYDYYDININKRIEMHYNERGNIERFICGRWVYDYTYTYNQNDSLFNILIRSDRVSKNIYIPYKL